MKKFALALSILICASCNKVEAIEIKEINKTVLNTFKMALGTFLLTQGLRGTVPVIALSVRVFKERARIGERGESDRNTEKVTMAGAIYASVTWFSMTAGGAKLLHDGYKGLTEEEISNTDRAQD